MAPSVPAHLNPRAANLPGGRDHRHGEGGKDAGTFEVQGSKPVTVSKAQAARDAIKASARAAILPAHSPLYVLDSASAGGPSAIATPSPPLAQPRSTSAPRRLGGASAHPAPFIPHINGARHARSSDQPARPPHLSINSASSGSSIGAATPALSNGISSSATGGSNHQALSAHSQHKVGDSQNNSSSSYKGGRAASPRSPTQLPLRFGVPALGAPTDNPIRCACDCGR
ncbi:hypothetical protein DUNSADRAFT_10648 [Dunaliella salina]|uniref:Encoded protein n=1 Tax=Dunaliella salina TaxID=3046 RepID=A0ABQ7GEV0_DUNSA|nr:hypothetical protein DUNSADRAFT_10648 [Dunaliella salina]|eukprot:KAF5833129.1 hypothetical protein DUNSADRAFT_10648 [Dunaliella salina]